MPLNDTQSPWADAPPPPPDSFPDPFATAPSDAGSSPRPTLSPGAPKALQDLTQKEVEALRSMRASMNRAKYGGGITGAGLALYFARTRKPPLQPLAAVFSTIMGAGVGYIALLPFVFYGAKRQMERVEDPQHMKTVLASAIDEIRSTYPVDRRAAGQYPTSAAAPTAHDTSRNPVSDVNTAGAAAGSTSASRWDELRGTKSQSASSWDKIRQQAGTASVASAQQPSDTPFAAAQKQDAFAENAC